MNTEMLSQKDSFFVDSQYLLKLLLPLVYSPVLRLTIKGDNDPRNIKSVKRKPNNAGRIVTCDLSFVTNRIMNWQIKKEIVTNAIII